MRTHLCGVLRTGRRRHRPSASAAGWPAGASTASTSPSWTCATTPGIIQCVIDHATDVRSEWVVAVTGTVRHRPEGTVNPAIGTGEVEIGDCTVEVLNEAEPPPFSVDDRDESDEPVRLRYRYVDLRRPRMQRNLRLRARVNAALRAAMDRQGFAEIETPLLWAPTPEGSREFSVPSRLHHGSFYALPQSPQLAKQLLMVGGFDRYFQIARCLRDEDLRADRQFEFMQLDMECSFASQDDVMGFVSEAVLDAAEAATGERPPPIERMTWAEARDRFGTDKPDLRFGMELVDLTEVFERTEVKAFSSPTVKAIVVPDGAAYPRKRLDELTEQAKRAGAAGLAWFRVVESGGAGPGRLDGPLARHLSERGGGARPGTDEGGTRGPHPRRLGHVRHGLRGAGHAARGDRGAARGAGPASIRLGRRLPHVRGRRRRRPPAGGAPPVHHAVSRGPAVAGDGPVGRALAGLRPRAERMGARVGERPYPRPAARRSRCSPRSASAPRRPSPASGSCWARSATARRRTPGSPSGSTAWRRSSPARRTSGRSSPTPRRSRGRTS